MSRPASHAGSVGSNKSNSSRTKYKTVSKDSYVDETLFGSPSRGKASDTAASPNNRSPNSKLKAAQSMRTTRGGHLIAENVTTLKTSDLARMKKASPIISPEEAQAMKAQAEAARSQKLSHALARKERMLKMEEERKAREPASETDRLKAEADSKILTDAQIARLEEQDDVKHMNQMQLYAKCVTIRDAQIEEKKHMMLEEEEENRRLDLMMEIERLKALEHYEERERLRALERVAGQKMLEEQIKQREQAKLMEEELMAQERAQMNVEIKRMEAEEAAARERKKQQAAMLLEEVAESNAEQIRRKKEVAEREAMEDLQIARYLAEKAARDEEHAAREAAIQKAKADEVSRLRAQQERAQDKQSEIDELRARRYQEAYEREWREKERAAAQRQQDINRDLLAAREAQQQAKLKNLADQALAERDEFNRILVANREKEYEEAAQASAQQTIRNRHKEELMNQIKANQEARKREDAAALEDGRRRAAAAQAQRYEMLRMKELKLEELKDSGVPDKYCSELQGKKISL
eukprot:jgi/Tetstr1/437835/TSEL_026475.t1